MMDHLERNNAQTPRALPRRTNGLITHPVVPPSLTGGMMERILSYGEREEVALGALLFTRVPGAPISSL
jgi:hypothetical protein